ncbi:MAG: hypothetical protein AB8H86_05300 [Polyangiales bacterium]
MRRLVCLVLISACAPQQTQELPSLDRDESINPAQVLAESPVLQAPAPQRRRGQEPVPDEVAGNEELAGAFTGLARVMAAMREASSSAAEAASSPCEAGRASYAAAIQAASDILESHPLPGGRQPPTLELATPQRYAELCASLPIGLQRCARFDYKTTHYNECETARMAVGEEERAAFDELARPATE